MICTLLFTVILYCHADFLAERKLPNPRSLSQTADLMLDVQAEIKRFFFYRDCVSKQWLIPTSSPFVTLGARRKSICDTCTTDPERPVMVEVGQEWKDHVQSRKHRRLRRERDCPKVSRFHKEKTSSILDSDNNLDLDLHI